LEKLGNVVDVVTPLTSATEKKKDGPNTHENRAAG
jgi:hypothetical protein